MALFKSLFLCQRFFYYMALIAVVFLVSYWIPVLFTVAMLMAFLLLILLSFDFWLLYQNKTAISAERHLPEKFSNSDNNPVPIRIRSTYNFSTTIEVIDELPVQFQKRDFFYATILPPLEQHKFEYSVRPVDRGEYEFGHLNVFCASPLKIFKRRFQFQNRQLVKVYPSIMQMQKYDFLAISNSLTLLGLKKIRRIGHTSEFEQIKEYVVGDDFRTINWKATAKHADLMVNQYQDEKSQPIYSIIDTGRVMKMPFNGLKLLDYAINASLAFSNVALKKQDKVGLLAFSKDIEQFLPAQQKPSYLSKILETLYNINTAFYDSDYSLLYAHIKRKIRQRGLLLLYTNFEHLSALKRQLPYLQALSKKHLLVVIIFENTELKQLLYSEATNLQDIYHKTIAEKFDYEKRLMVLELQKHGIQSVLTKPEDLTINTINKYLEIKARGLL